MNTEQLLASIEAEINTAARKLESPLCALRPLWTLLLYLAIILPGILMLRSSHPVLTLSGALLLGFSGAPVLLARYAWDLQDRVSRLLALRYSLGKLAGLSSSDDPNFRPWLLANMTLLVLAAGMKIPPQEQEQKPHPRLTLVK